MSEEILWLAGVFYPGGGCTLLPPNSPLSQTAMTDFALDELGRLRISGFPMYVEHEGPRIGRWVAGYLDPVHGDAFCLGYVDASTEAGRKARDMVLHGDLKELSFHHKATRKPVAPGKLSIKKYPLEISLVHEGMRPGCSIKDIRLLREQDLAAVLAQFNLPSLARSKSAVSSSYSADSDSDFDVAASKLNKPALDALMAHLFPPSPISHSGSNSYYHQTGPPPLSIAASSSFSFSPVADLSNKNSHLDKSLTILPSLTPSFAHSLFLPPMSAPTPAPVAIPQAPVAAPQAPVAAPVAAVPVATPMEGVVPTTPATPVAAPVAAPATPAAPAAPSPSAVLAKEVNQMTDPAELRATALVFTQQMEKMQKENAALASRLQAVEQLGTQMKANFNDRWLTKAKEFEPYTGENGLIDKDRLKPAVDFVSQQLANNTDLGQSSALLQAMETFVDVACSNAKAASNKRKLEEQVATAYVNGQAAAGFEGYKRAVTETNRVFGSMSAPTAPAVQPSSSTLGAPPVVIRTAIQYEMERMNQRYGVEPPKSMTSGLPVSPPEQRVQNAQQYADYRTGNVATPQTPAAPQQAAPAAPQIPANNSGFGYQLPQQGSSLATMLNQDGTLAKSFHNVQQQMNMNPAVMEKWANYMTA